jgi:hypothetical protein
LEVVILKKEVIFDWNTDEFLSEISPKESSVTIPIMDEQMVELVLTQ